jgi:hypothetical protein
LHNTHANQLLRAPVLIENIIGVLTKLLHVSADEHLTKFYKIAMVLIVYLYDTPRVGTATNFTTVRCLHHAIGANDSEGNLASNFFRFSKCFLIFILIGWRLEDLDLVMSDVSKDLT